MGTADVTRFLDVTREYRWAVGFRLGVLYGLRRSEVLALHWDDLDLDLDATLGNGQSLRLTAEASFFGADGRRNV